jgi:hypothetical protein
VQSEEVFALLSTILILAGVVVMVMSMRQRGRLRELAFKERLALIERGLAPPPEVDPARFERAMGELNWDERIVERAARYRRSGVIIIGLGGAIWMIIAFAAGEPAIAFGIGGAIVIVGLALYFISELELRHASRFHRPDSTEPRTEPRT